MFLALMMVCFFAAQVNAQGNGEIDVFSGAVLYDDGEGNGILELKISADLPSTIELKTFVVEGDVVINGGFAGDLTGATAGTVFSVTVPLKEKGTYSAPGTVEVEISYRDNHSGQLLISRKRAKHMISFW